MSLLALPHELVHEVSAYLDCLDRYHLALVLIGQIDYLAATLRITVPPNALKSERIVLVKQWRQDQIAAQFGVNPLQFWPSTHHHCFRCHSPLKMTILHSAPGREEVYRIKVVTDKLYNPRWRSDRIQFLKEKTHVFYHYLNYAYSSPHYGCSGIFERVDVVSSPQPTELHKECDTCHLKARGRVSNTCRTCDRDYGVLPCSCGASVCLMCLQHDSRQLAALCHRCLRFTCAACSTACSTPGCQQWLCATCKDIPQQHCQEMPPPVATPALVVKETASDSEVESDVDIDGLFGD